MTDSERLARKFLEGKRSEPVTVEGNYSPPESGELVPCSPCGGKGGFAGRLKCRTCNGTGKHPLTAPAKWIYIERP